MRRAVLPVVLAALAALATSVAIPACATHTFVRPAGPLQPAPEAGQAWTAATATCRPVTAYVGALGLSGRIGDRRIRNLADATLDAAVTSAGQIGLEARVSGQFVFKLGGATDRATLILEDRVVTAPANAIVDALIGLKIEPASLMAILTGCVSASGQIERSGKYSDDLIEVVTTDATAYIARESNAWRPRAGVVGDFTVDYVSFDRGVPNEIKLSSGTAHSPQVSLSLRIRSFALNTSVPPAAFAVSTPPGAASMSLDELRQAGPLGRMSDGR